MLKDRIYDLKQVLKIARSHKFKLSADEQMETITLKIKERLRRCLVVHPLTEYFMKTDPSTIQNDLIQAEVSLGTNNEGVENHSEDELLEKKKRKDKRDKYKERTE